MRLIEWLAEARMTRTAFARKTGLSEGTISLLCRGQIWPTRATAEKIMVATDRQVTPNDFLLPAE